MLQLMLAIYKRTSLALSCSIWGKPRWGR